MAQENGISRVFRISDLWVRPYILANFYNELSKHRAQDIQRERRMAQINGYDVDAWLKYKRENQQPVVAPRLRNWDSQFLARNLKIRQR